MRKHVDRHAVETAPMSKGPADVTQVMLQAGMINAPERPGACGSVGRFEVLRPLGAGGMGQVFLAREPVTEGRVAIKMIHPRYLKTDWAVRRFLTEARHMYQMSHPHILKVLEVSDRRKSPYYVMPFVEGGSLADLIQPGQPLPEDRIVEIARSIAEALQYAHSRGIIHRDLKPANVLLDKDGRAYLTDFGLLRTVFNDDMVDPDNSSPEGTAPYLSPLAACGKAEDTRCDIYAFGAVLYEMLTGTKPYDGPNAHAIVARILAGPPRPIREVNPGAPAGLVRIAESCMARELRDRYAEMADVVRDFDRAAQKEEPLGPRGASAGQVVMTLKLSGKRSVGKVLAIAGTLLHGLCAVTLLWSVIEVVRALTAGHAQRPDTLSAALGSAAAPFAFGYILGGVAGWFLLLIAMVGCRYRAPWFYRALHVVAIPWLLVFPVGTIVGALVLIYLRQHRAEFAAEPPAAKPSLFMYFEYAGVLVVVLLIAGSFGRLAYTFARPHMQHPSRLASTAKLDSGAARNLSARAWRAWREKRYEEAEKLFMQATQATPRHADAWNGLGWARQNMGLTQSAKEAFEQAVALDPKLAGALAGLASTCFEMAHYDQAEKHAQTWLSLKPGNAEAARILKEARLRLEEAQKQTARP